MSELGYVPDAEALLRRLFAAWQGEEATTVQKLALSGSSRQYYRLSTSTHSAIGVQGPTAKENAAFIGFARALRSAEVNVPEIYAVDLEHGCYLQQDLGSTSLYEVLVAERAANGGAFTPRLKELYKRTLAALFDIQTKGRAVVDFKLCYPRAAFDKQSMMWDLQYFKYYFLKLAGIDYDEALLERDFATLIEHLEQASSRFFLYRDFQSRNIMIAPDDQPWFIDFQGGRKGARQYDVASLLYDGKADIPTAVRGELLAFYVAQLRPQEQAAFSKYYYAFALMRLMQAMGSYGYRGYFERKEHFLKSIPYALDNLKEITQAHRPDLKIDELWRVWQRLIDSKKLREVSAGPPLTVTVLSFSYKHGIPVDTSGNGGGFVFDCRALPNPGRELRYKHSTGRDTDVKMFFDQHHSEMEPFLDAARKLVGISVGNYRSRGFQHLQVAFGCTGGQHRSVYCAEQVAQWLPFAFPGINVELRHGEV